MGDVNTKKDLWQELEHFGLHLTSEQKKHTWFTVHLFECLIEDSTISLGDMTHAESSHRPVSVSCASNCCAKL